MEQKLLETYNLKTLDPQVWDADSRDLSFGSESHDMNTINNNSSSSSEEDEGYQMLLELVNKDTTAVDSIDPLTGKPVHQMLRELKLDEKDALKFSIGSKQFSAKQFLKFLHNRDSFEQLQQSLNTLEDSIVQKNKQLKSLITTESLRFVRSKSSLDDVLTQFQKSGFNDEDSGLKSLKSTINDANKEATLLIKPIMQNKQKEMKLRQSIEFIQKKKFFFNLPKSLRSYIQEKDYDNLIHDYKRAKELKANESDKIINRIWEDVENIIDLYKKQLWIDLKLDFNEDFLKIIKKLIELDTIDNPIIDWIHFKLNNLTTALNDTFNRYHEKILNVQLNILSTLDSSKLSSFLNESTISSQYNDSIIIIEMWGLIEKLMNSLQKVAMDFIKFWYHVENFFNGSYQNQLSLEEPFDHFQKYEIDDIRAKGEEFIDLFIHKLIRFFNSTQESLKNFHTNEDLGDGSIESFGFIPPFTNTLSALQFLPKILTTISETLNELGQLVISDKCILELRDSYNLVNERVISAICSIWLKDCRNFYRLEDWVKAGSGETLIPSLILQFESYILEKLSGMLFFKLPEAPKAQIIRYPSKKILTGVEIQFLRSFDVLLESIIKKIIEENDIKTIDQNIKNYHKLLTFLNIRKMKTLIPKILMQYDDYFQTSITNQNLEIYAILGKMEDTVFQSYLSEQKKILGKILNEGINKIDWLNISEAPRRVSSYMYETLNVLIQVYSNVLQVSKDLISKVLKSLTEAISSVLLQNFRDLNEISKEGLRQCLLDLEFFKAIVGRIGGQTTVNNVNLIYKTFGSDVNRLLKENEKLLHESVNGSKIEYKIFN